MAPHFTAPGEQDHSPHNDKQHHDSNYDASRDGTTVVSSTLTRRDNSAHVDARLRNSATEYQLLSVSALHRINVHAPVHEWREQSAQCRTGLH